MYRVSAVAAGAAWNAAAHNMNSQVSMRRFAAYPTRSRAFECVGSCAILELHMAKRKEKPASLFDVDVDTSGPIGPHDDEHVPLHEAAQTRYLNYALSVITSRA